MKLARILFAVAAMLALSAPAYAVDPVTTSCRIIQMTSGSNSSTWGTKMNAGLAMLEECAVGQVSISVTAGNVTLTTNDNATDQSRPAILIFTGTPGTTRTITAPNVKKWFWLVNNSDSSITFGAGGGTTVTVVAGGKATVYTDAATNAVRLDNSSDANWVGAALSVANGGTGLAAGTSGGIPYYSGTTTIASSALLTNHALVVGGGAGATPSVVASLGTSTTLLHGAAAGNPTWGAVSLTADVSGTLAAGNGGTGLTTGTSGGVPYFSSSSTFASSAALTQYAITLGGGAAAAPVSLASLGTSTTILHGAAAGAPTWSAVSLTADVTGTLGLTNGGTGQTSAGSAFGALSPLTTKGDVLSFSTVNARLGVGTDGQVLTADSTQTTGLKWAAGGSSCASCLLIASNLSDVANASTSRSNLGLVIGTNVEAHDADLTAIAALTSAADKVPYATGAQAWALATLTSTGRSLIDDTSVGAMRTTLGLGSLATASTVNDADWSGTDLAVGNGGTGASTAATARTNLGIDVNPAAYVVFTWNGSSVTIINSAHSTSVTRTSTGVYNWKPSVDADFATCTGYKSGGPPLICAPVGLFTGGFNTEVDFLNDAGNPQDPQRAILVAY